MGGLVVSGLAAASFSGWWPAVIPAGGVRIPRNHPFSGEGLGEPVGVALGWHEVGVVAREAVCSKATWLIWRMTGFAGV